jgi:UDP-glucose 4-epimerase
MLRDNAVATARMIDYARDAQARTFIYCSSLSVYGKIATAVVDESTPISNPDAYGLTKYLGEIMLREAAPSLRSLSIRLPGVIGPASVRNWLTQVLAAAKETREISYYNPAGPYNNAIHIKDLCRFIEAVLRRPDWAGADAVTVAAAGMTTVREAVETIVRTVGSRSALVGRESGQPGFTISIEHARAVYGYDPADIASVIHQFAVENL